MNNTKHCHLVTLCLIEVKGNKTYCTPRPDTILELLKKYHDIEIGRRWHFQCTRDLEDAGYIFRRKRPVYNRESGVFSRPSLFALTKKGCHYLIKKGVSGARIILKLLLDWLKKKDGRWPKEEDAGGDFTSITFDKDGKLKILMKPT